MEVNTLKMNRKSILLLLYVRIPYFIKPGETPVHLFVDSEPESSVTKYDENHLFLCSDDCTISDFMKDVGLAAHFQFAIELHVITYHTTSVL